MKATLTETGVAEILERIAAHLAALREAQERNTREWLTVEEAANELQVSRDTIERLIGCGKLKAAEIATDESKGFRRRYRIKREWLDAYLSLNIAQSKLATSQIPRQRLDKSVDFIGV